MFAENQTTCDIRFLLIFSRLAIAQQLQAVNERYNKTQNANTRSFDKYIIYQDQTVGSVFIGLYILQLAVGHTIDLLHELQIKVMKLS